MKFKQPPYPPIRTWADSVSCREFGLQVGVSSEVGVRIKHLACEIARLLESIRPTLLLRAIRHPNA